MSVPQHGLTQLLVSGIACSSTRLNVKLKKIFNRHLHNFYRYRKDVLILYINEFTRIQKEFKPTVERNNKKMIISLRLKHTYTYCGRGLAIVCVQFPLLMSKPR